MEEVGQARLLPKRHIKTKGSRRAPSRSLEATVLAQLCCVTSGESLNLHVFVSSSVK